MLRMSMDRVSTVDSFEEIGFTNPIKSQSSLADARKFINALDFTKNVYPSTITDPLYKNVEDHPYSDIF